MLILRKKERKGSGLYNYYRFSGFNGFNGGSFSFFFQVATLFLFRLSFVGVFDEKKNFLITNMFFFCRCLKEIAVMIFKDYNLLLKFLLKTFFGVF